jgi:hypothetical protein
MLLAGSIPPPPPPPLYMGGGGTLTHRENVGAGAHVLPAESGQQLNSQFYGFFGPVIKALKEPKGVGKVAYVRHRYWIVAIDVLLAFNFCCYLYFNVFPFPPSKPILIGDVLMNRQNAAARRFFSLFCNAHCLVMHRLVGDARQTEKKSAK